VSRKEEEERGREQKEGKREKGAILAKLPGTSSGQAMLAYLP
jgi:hypothetical protein